MLVGDFDGRYVRDTPRIKGDDVVGLEVEGTAVGEIDGTAVG
jgi:hypothetical protein